MKTLRRHRYNIPKPPRVIRYVNIPAETRGLATLKAELSNPGFAVMQASQVCGVWRLELWKDPA